MLTEGLSPDRSEVEAVEQSRGLQPTGEVHPVADLFPMMTDDELDDLSADIKTNGLLHPIVLDENGTLIDGRNRLAGCRRAGVKPTFTLLNGNDPVAFIIGSNVTRRHMSKGQQAMAVARARDLSKDFTVRSIAVHVRVSHQYVHMAVTVIEYASHLVESVLLGAVSLSDAYEEARRHKEGRATFEEQTEREEKERQGRLAKEQAEENRKLMRLQSECPELAIEVTEGRLTIGGAVAEWQERQRKQEEQVATITKMFSTGLNYLDPRHWEVDRFARGWLKADPNRLEDADFSADRARRVAAALIRYAEIKEGEDV